MDKMLSKSKSRFFGKKKSSKNLGISSSDSLATGPQRLVNGGASSLSALQTQPSLAPETVPDSGISGRILNGPPSRIHHPGSSGMGSGHPTVQDDHKNFTQSFSRPSHQGSASQSRFEVHISPKAFSPISIPSSTTPDPASSSSFKDRDTSEIATTYANVENTPRVGEGLTHGRSQSSVSPNETPNFRSRSRRHAIPANFLESVGATSGGLKKIWNGQSLGPDQFLNTQNSKNKSPSSFPSQTALVHPSASAPVTSWLSNTDTSFNSAELAPIHEDECRTDPAMFSASSNSSGQTPLPRSIPSHNLAGLTPSSSDTIDQRRPSEVSHHHPAQRSYRGTLPHPHISNTPHRPQRGSPQSLSSSSPTRASEATAIQKPLPNHRKSPTVGSEKEIGYKGLAFPLPPSSEEGLATSYSSSQSSLYSTVSARRSGDQSLTPKDTSDGTLHGGHEQGPRLLRSTETRGVLSGIARSTGDKKSSTTMPENRVSPILNVRMTRRQLDGAVECSEHVHTNELIADGVRDIKHQDRVVKQTEHVLDARSQQHELSNETHPPIRVRAVSEAPRPHPSSARSQIQPEPTKPLVLNSSRKILHTTRSFTTLAEPKQLQPSSSSRDLSGAFNGCNGKEERVRIATAIPVRSGPRALHDRDGQTTVSASPIRVQRSNGQSSTPPSFPLPTPPNSSSTLSVAADEIKNAETKSAQDGPTRPEADGKMHPLSPLTLEEVTQALYAQRVKVDELSGHILRVAQRHIAEKDTYAERVIHLEGTVAKLEREIRGLRWLVLENTKAHRGSVSGASFILDAAAAAGEQSSENNKLQKNNEESVATDRKLRRSSTMPHMPTLVHRPGHPRNKRFGGLGLDFSPESTGSSPLTISSLTTPSRFEVDIGDEEHTPSMDEIIDKLMAVRQWAGSDVRVSIVESIGGVGESKRIVFRQV